MREYFYCKTLSVRNIGIIKEADIDFGRGLNIITGETGAGKSLIVNSFNLVLGEKAESSLIRKGEDEAVVEAIFEVCGYERIINILESMEIDINDELWIKRVIYANGRSKAWINGQVVSVGFLKKIGVFIADLCGSHSHQELLNSENHINMIDKLANNDSLLKEWQTSFNNYRSLIKKAAEIAEEEKKKEEKIILIQAKLKDLEKINSISDSEEELLARHNVMADREKVLEELRFLKNMLSTDENGIAKSLYSILDSVKKLSEYNRSFSDYANELETLHNVLLELENDVSIWAENLDFSQDEMEYVEEAIFELKRLKNKYGMNLKELKKYYEDLKKELSEVENIEIVKKDILNELEKAKNEYFKAKKKLSINRKRSAELLRDKLLIELNDLAIKDADFQVLFFDSNIDGIPVEKAEFYIKTNAGSDENPLKNIVSSGEASRIMLALKKIFSDTDEIPVLIFDEIDANIGGETALKVGEKFEEIKENHQLIVITHMPQIAKFADYHFSVKKTSRSGKTFVSVKQLDEKERIAELSRMLGGLGITSVVEKHAKELIKSRRKK